MSHGLDPGSRRILDALEAISGDLDLESVLRRVTETAMELVGARYGALGVVRADDDPTQNGRLVSFIPVGLSPAEVGRIDHWPHGDGLLGLLIDEPQVVRIAEIASHPASAGFPPGHPPMHSFLGVPVHIGDEVYGNLYLTDKRDGSGFDEDDEAIAVAFASVAGLTIRNARLFGQSRRREAYLGASAEVATSLLSGTAHSDVLDLIARRGLEIGDADLAAVVVAVDGENLEVQAVAGQGDQTALGMRLNTESLSGATLRAGHYRLVDDVSETNAPFLDKHAGMRAGLLIPLGTPQRALGVLVLARRPGRISFTERSVSALQSFAGQAALALSMAEARRAAERLSVFEDRDRIARDLHDVVIQRLFASAMVLMSTLPRIDDAAVAARIRDTVDDLDTTIRQIRSTIFALQTEAESVGLRARILAAVESATAILGFAPGVELSGTIDTDVPEQIGDQVVAVLGEALTNV
ncbi:MAG: sensor histidine kinase, partial [Jiangellaceae bacterium]